MTDKPRLVRISEAAQMLGVNPETLRRWDREGRLKAIRLGKRGDRRYNTQDIQDLMNNKAIP